MEPSTIAIVVILAFIGGAMVFKVYDFITNVGAEDEKDKVIDKLTEVISEAEKSLKGIKDKVRVVQSKYLECQEHCTDVQLRLDEANNEVFQLKKQLKNDSDSAAS